MAERIDIIITDQIASGIEKKLINIGKAASKAADDIANLDDEIGKSKKQADSLSASQDKLNKSYLASESALNRAITSENNAIASSKRLETATTQTLIANQKLQAENNKTAISQQKLKQETEKNTQAQLKSEQAFNTALKAERAASVELSKLEAQQNRTKKTAVELEISQDKLNKSYIDSENSLNRAIVAENNAAVSNKKLETAKTQNLVANEQLEASQNRTKASLQLVNQANLKTAASQQRLKTETANTNAAVQKTKLTYNNAKTANQKLGTEIERTRLRREQANAAASRAAIAEQKLINVKKNLTSNTKKSGDALLGFTKGLLAVESIKRFTVEIVRLADSYTLLQNRIGTVTDTQEQSAIISQELFQIANDTRTNINATAQAFQRFDRAIEGLGGSQRESLELTETLNQALKLGGLTTGEQSAALLQLSQAFNKGKLDGDEFRTVIETLPRIADAIAEELGITRGELLKLAPEGKITAQVLREGIAGAAEDINAEFEKLKPTVSEAFTTLKNRAIESVGELDKATNASARLAQNILTIGDVFETSSDGISEFIGEIKEFYKEAPKFTQGILDVLSFSPGGYLLDKYRGNKGDVAPTTTTDTNIETSTNVLRGANKDVAAKAAGKERLDNLDKIYSKLLKENAILSETQGVSETFVKLSEITNNLKAKGIDITASEKGALLDLISANEELSKARRVDETLKGLLRENNLLVDLKDKYNAEADSISIISSLKSDGVRLTEAETSAIKDLLEANSQLSLARKFDETLKSLQEEQQLLNNIAGVYGSQANAIEVVNGFRTEGLELTKEQEQSISVLVVSIEDQKRAQSELNNIYTETIGKQKGIEASIAATNAAYKDGLITLSDYQSRLSNLNVEESTLKLKQGLGDFEDFSLTSLGRIADGYEGFQLSLSDSFGQFFTTLTDGFADSIGQAIVYSEDLGESLRETARGAIAEFISQLIKAQIEQQSLNLISSISSSGGGGGIGGAIVGVISGAVASSSGGGTVGSASGGGSGAFATYQTGGYTGSGQNNELAGSVHKNEFVMNAGATSRLGVGQLQSLQNGTAQIQQKTGSNNNQSQQPIIVQAPQVQRDPITIVNVPQESAEQYLNSPAGNSMFINKATENAQELKQIFGVNS